MYSQREIRNSLAGSPCLHKGLDRLMIECETSHEESAIYRTILGHAVAQLVEALCYKQEGCVFDSLWCHCNFLLT
jgi:hypothetical protein